MPFSLTDLLYGFVVPTIVALMLSWSLRRWLPEPIGRAAEVFSFIAAFHAGYWLLSLGAFQPEFHWHWLPWAVAATVVSGLSTSGKVTPTDVRLDLTIIVTCLAASWLVPDWEHLTPSGGLHMLVFVGMVVPTTVLLERVAGRVGDMSFPVILAGLMTAAAVVSALAGSLRFAQMAGCGVAALTGIAVANRLTASKVNNESLAFPFTLLIASLMLISRVNSFSNVPLVSYLLLPVASLTFWMSVRGPLAKKFIWIGRLMPLALAAIAVGIAVYAEFGSESDW